MTRPVKIIHFSATGLDVVPLSRALAAHRDGGGQMELSVRTSMQLSNPAGVEEFVNIAASQDAAVITLHGGPDSFPARKLFEERLSAASNPPVIHVQPEGGDLDSLEWALKISRGLAPGDLEAARRYLALGGAQNLKGFLSLISRAIRSLRAEDAAQAPSPPPEAPPFEGLHHPDKPNIVEADYLAEAAASGKPVIGLWFYQTWWLNGTLGHIDALIRALEERGAWVIPVFHARWKDADLGNPGAAHDAERFFLGPGGEPRIDVLVSPMSFSMTATSPDCRDLFENIGVPVIQAICSLSAKEDWAASTRGLSPLDVTLSAAQPEMDGNIITVPFAFKERSLPEPLTGALGIRWEPDAERTGKVADLALNWAKLRRIPNSSKRLAIIFHHYPPRNDRIGCAAGLDSFQSVADLLAELHKAGYYVPRLFNSGDELAAELVSRPTPDKRWVAASSMSPRAEAKAGPELYLPWTENLPPSVKARMMKDWGEAPGDLMVHDGDMLFSGFADGNVFITIQPSRGTLESLEKGYHDPYLSAPHQYLAQYRWLRDVWGAMALIHVGKHGSLEWLPGKSAGLSRECLPDLAITDLPNIYPYIVNDPGEGTQAKRRSYAVIVDHMTPGLTTGGLYDDLEKISSLMAERSLALMEDPGKADILSDQIWEAAKKANLDRDLGISAAEAPRDFEGFSARLHSYLGTLSGTMIADGLHVLGRPPEGKLLSETLVQLTRMAAPGRPSLREAVAKALNLTLDDLENPDGVSYLHSPAGFGEPPKSAAPFDSIEPRPPDSLLAAPSDSVAPQSSCAWPAARVHNLSLALVEALRDADFDFNKAKPSFQPLIEAARAAEPRMAKGPESHADLSIAKPSEPAAGHLAAKHLTQSSNSSLDEFILLELMDRLRWIAESLAPDLLASTNEMANTLKALSGGFVPPGPSGAPSRGQTEALPTGRAFYSVDPRKIPSPAAWEVGQRLGEALLARFLNETGRYPKNVGVLVYGTSTMRTRGDDIAEILFLWGLKPVWRAGGAVDGLEVAPLSELGRPRIDATARISGLFRDAFPHLVELLDKGASMVAALRESPEDNFLRAHVLSDIALLRRQGLDESEAEREATFRVFGCPPGTYGAGVAELIESGRWKTVEELGESYIRHSGHAYGQGGSWGLTRPEGLRRSLARMEATVKNEDSREYDILSCTDYYNYYGGLIAAVKTVRGAPAMSLVGDSSDPQRVRISSAGEEARRVLRARLVNPKWIEGLKRHGFKGAGEISHMMDVLLGWDATANVVEDWMWEAAARSWVLNPDTSEWLGQVNPFARRNMIDKLLEAISRGLWKAPDEMAETLKNEYLDLEGRIEELGDDPPLAPPLDSIKIKSDSHNPRALDPGGHAPETLAPKGHASEALDPGAHDPEAPRLGGRGPDNLKPSKTGNSTRSQRPPA